MGSYVASVMAGLYIRFNISARESFAAAEDDEAAAEAEATKLRQKTLEDVF